MQNNKIIKYGSKLGAKYTSIMKIKRETINRLIKIFLFLDVSDNSACKSSIAILIKRIFKF